MSIKCSTSNNVVVVNIPSDYGATIVATIMYMATKSHCPRRDVAHATPAYDVGHRMKQKKLAVDRGFPHRFLVFHDFYINNLTIR